MYQIEPIVLHRGVASASTRSLIYQCRALSLTTSTFRPRRSSRSCISSTWSIKLVPGSISTRMSMSLSGLASPLATEPKTRTLRAPCLAAMARISWRLDFSNSSNLMDVSCPTLQSRLSPSFPRSFSPLSESNRISRKEHPFYLILSTP
jgi:hypothetical protein